MNTSMKTPSESPFRKSSLAGTSVKLALGMGAAMLIPSLSHALIVTYELRALPSTTNGVLVSDQGVGATTVGVVVSADGHTVTIADNLAPNANIVFQLYAVFATPNALDTIGKSTANIISFGTTGGITGAIRSSNVVSNITTNSVAPFNSSAAGASAGFSNELSGLYDPNRGALTNPSTGGATTTQGGTFASTGTADAITDLGGLITNGNTSGVSTFFGAATATATGDGNGGNPILLGEFKLTLGAGAAAGSTTLGYYLRPRTGGSSANIFSNTIGAAGGALVGYNYLGSNSTGTVTNAFGYQGITVNVTGVPEPSAFGMLALGALGLVGFRRMGLRRTA